MLGEEQLEETPCVYQNNTNLQSMMIYLKFEFRKNCEPHGVFGGIIQATVLSGNPGNC